MYVYEREEQKNDKDLHVREIVNSPLSYLLSFFSLYLVFSLYLLESNPYKQFSEDLFDRVSIQYTHPIC